MKTFRCDLSEDILASSEDSIGLVQLNRPDTHNAITKQMWKALPGIFDNLKRHGAKTIVLAGQGDSFASGADLCELAQLKDFQAASDFWISIENCLKALSEFDLPIIAMIQGSCFGGGCLLATACDMRFAAKNATFGIPIAKLGIVLDDASIGRLISIVGSSFASRILYTGDIINIDDAAKHGLVDQTFELAALHCEVMQIASLVARNDAHALTETKRSISRIRSGMMRGSASEVNGQEQRQMIIQSYLSAEFRERIAKAIELLK